MNPFLFFPNFPLLLFCSQFRGQEPKEKYHQLSRRKQPLKVLYISTGILWILSSLTTLPPSSMQLQRSKSQTGAGEPAQQRRAALGAQTQDSRQQPAGVLGPTCPAAQQFPSETCHHLFFLLSCWLCLGLHTGVSENTSAPHHVYASFNLGSSSPPSPLAPDKPCC